MIWWAAGVAAPVNTFAHRFRLGPFRRYSRSALGCMGVVVVIDSEYEPRLTPVDDSQRESKSKSNLFFLRERPKRTWRSTRAQTHAKPPHQTTHTRPGAKRKRQKPTHKTIRSCWADLLLFFIRLCSSLACFLALFGVFQFKSACASFIFFFFFLSSLPLLVCVHGVWRRRVGLLGVVAEWQPPKLPCPPPPLPQRHRHT